MPFTTLPPGIGIGYKHPHFREILDRPECLAFLEVHAENYMGAGGPPLARLDRLARDYPLSLHGVGLSIGSPEPLDREHLLRVKALCQRYQPASFSEHLAWSRHQGTYFADLLPLPYNDRTLDIVCRHIEDIQDTLERPMLLENPSTYVSFGESRLTETDFLTAVVQRTGCGLLLDLTNAHICAVNHGGDASAYVAALPQAAIGELHLAGHSQDRLPDGTTLLIDTHDGPISAPVRQLLAETIARIGPTPTLIEWDAKLPDWTTLHQEVLQVDRTLMQLADGFGEEARHVGER